ncbi:hypothetical protein [Staphylococcus caprae]|uniref:hypothetical protein n=1 Tax=Staphylococcus caprae TaxID=29380 RepID=UPI000CD18874|nr:hypothetical protein [Staphylococcus caprae]POA02258.1 hypothetical protein CD155_11800 [Staphylococcus caprae]SUL94550.1 putative lipoprotein [Staphylococcus caprae]
MKKLITVVLCASMILEGCSFMDKDQTKDIPKKVSVKSYDGKYIGEHKKRNEEFKEKYKDKAKKQYKKYVKDTFGLNCKINLVDAYTNSSGFSEKSKTDGLVVVGTVDYDVPFQLRLIFVESDNGLTITTFTPGHDNETSVAVAAMMYKRYENDIEQARHKFKHEVEKNGYYAMNTKLQKKQEFNGVTKQYLNFNTSGIEGLDKFKKEFKPIMKMNGQEFNQQFDSLLAKHPEIKKQAESDFIAYYKDNENRDKIADYVWNLQKPINNVMKLYPGKKFVRFYKDNVSPTKIDGHGRLKSESEEISIAGGKYDERK